MTTLLLDEMLSPRIAEGLRRDGVDVRCVSEQSSLRGMSDDDLLELCCEQGWVLVTCNIRDFVPLGRARDHPGIVLVGSKAFPTDGSFVGRVTRALTARLREEGWPHPGAVDFL